MNDPLYRATMLTGMASTIRLLLAGRSRSSYDPTTLTTCESLCEAMERMAREEEKHSKTFAYGEFVEGVHAAYSFVQPPYVMLTDAEKIRTFDLLRMKLYPNGRDPFHRR